jgi:hypothetical protein
MQVEDLAGGTLVNGHLISGRVEVGYSASVHNELFKRENQLEYSSFQTHPLGESLCAEYNVGEDIAVALMQPHTERLKSP